MNGSTITVELPKAPVAAAPKQERAVLTRKHLMSAARDIFAKDGFEHARIEEIAARAGKTRGAFYANFDDKEDVFFAILEEDIIRSQKKINPLLQEASTKEERIQALSGHFAELLRDHQRTLLYLEFKLYAIRHPRKRKRLAQLHAAMCVRTYMTDVEKWFPETAGGSLSAKRKRSLQISSALDGLALNLLFDPGVLDENQLQGYLQTNLEEALRWINRKFISRLPSA